MKTGLHRELRINATFLAEKPSELSCSLVFREIIPKDVYYYYEELVALKRFEFWPHVPHDIEKP